MSIFPEYRSPELGMLAANELARKARAAPGEAPSAGSRPPRRQAQACRTPPKVVRSARTCSGILAGWTVSHTNIPPRNVSIDRGRQDSCERQRLLPEKPTRRSQRLFRLQYASRSKCVPLPDPGCAEAEDGCEPAQAALPRNRVLACNMQLRSIP